MEGMMKTNPRAAPRQQTLEELAFAEARLLLKGRTLTARDGLWAVGEHCEISATLDRSAGQPPSVELSFQAYRPEVVDWSKLCAVLRSGEALQFIYLDPSGAGAAAVGAELRQATLALHGRIIAFPGARLASERSSAAPAADPVSHLAVFARSHAAAEKVASAPAIRRAHLPAWELELIVSADGNLAVVGRNLDRRDLDGARVSLFFVSQQSGRVVAGVPLLRLESVVLNAELARPFGLEPGRYWYNGVDYHHIPALAEDCFLEAAVLPPGRSV
jgi:hypothetical protein